MKKFKAPSVQVLEFDIEEIITTSDPDPTDFDLPEVEA